MINLRVLFGWIPNTAEYEASQDALRKELSDLTAFAQSDELAEYLELEKTVHSSEFALRKKNILRGRFSDTAEFKKEKEYLSLKKRKDIQRYYKTKNSVALKDFLEFEKSYDLKHFHTLETLINSEEFHQVKKRLGRKGFKGSPEYQKYLEFQSLKNADRIKDHLAFKVSRDYVNFTLLIGAEKITAYEDLEKYVQSPEFIKVKDYMTLPGKTRLEMSEEFQLEKKYLELKNSEKFKWFFATRNSKKFDEIRRWTLSFSDEFDGHILDKKKWLTRYFWGEALLQDSYVNEGEKQFYPEDHNIQLDNSVMKIVTRKQRVTGKIWNPSIGFYPKEFDFTSGIINSGGSFRQQFGLFEAKIRFNLNQPVNHAFWMIGDLMLPHIDVARAGKKIGMGNYTSNPNAKGGIGRQRKSLNRTKYGSDFQIFSLEWTRQRLTWKLNGVKIMSTMQGVPQVPMFINLSSALYQDVNGSVLPAEVDVDWVRCYKPVEKN